MVYELPSIGIMASKNCVRAISDQALATVLFFILYACNLHFHKSTIIYYQLMTVQLIDLYADVCINWSV
jgi:hypothetical protein